MSNWARVTTTNAAQFQTREADGRRWIEGYFAVFGGRYDLGV